MARGRSKAQLFLSSQERDHLATLARSRSLPNSLTRRAQVILCGANGESNRSMAQRMRLSESTVGRWLARFAKLRMEGLHDRPRPGRPHKLESERVARLVETALNRQPTNGSNHWTVRSLALATDIPKSTVQRYLKSAIVLPGRTN